MAGNYGLRGEKGADQPFHQFLNLPPEIRHLYHLPPLRQEKHPSSSVSKVIIARSKFRTDAQHIVVDIVQEYHKEVHKLLQERHGGTTRNGRHLGTTNRLRKVESIENCRLKSSE